MRSPLRRTTLLLTVSGLLGEAPARAVPPAMAAAAATRSGAGGAPSAASPDPTAMTLTALPDGAFQLRAGTAALARIALTTPALRLGTPRVRAVQVDHHHVAEVRVPVRGRPAEEVWIGDVGVKPPRVIWSGIAGPQDADEETGLAVEATPDRIYEYQTAAHVTRCDGEPVRLFTRAWDFASSRFRPVLATPPAPVGQRLTARRADPAMPTARPLGGFHFTAASTTEGAGTDARRLSAPAALDDGDPKTIWAEGMGGDGRGEFLTARASAGRYRVRGVRVIPGDASTPATWRARNRIKSLSLAFGPEPERRFEVEFPEDPAAAEGNARAAYWIALPTPVEAACVTVTIRDVYRGSETAPAGGGGTTAISDLEIFTELDQPAGAERLIADIATGTECRSRVPLLVALGEAAVLPTAQTILGASGAGRECLVDALTRIDAATKSGLAMDALAAALVGASAEEERLILRTFQQTRARNGAAVPVRAIGELLASPKAQPDDRVRAARVLGELDEPDAARTLLASVGAQPAALRFAIVQALGKSPQARLADLIAAIGSGPAQGGAGGEADGVSRRADLLRALPALARRHPAEHTAALAALRRALVSGQEFEVRGRAVMALGSVGDPSVVTDLSQLRARSDDAVLRFLATRELAGLATTGGPPAVAALREALGDDDPRVREAGAQGLGQLRERSVEDALIHAAKAEPWPFARRAQLEALTRTCGPQARNLMVRAMERDVDEVRRAAIVGVVRCQDARARMVVLTILKARHASATLRELAGSLVAELDAEHRDQALAKDVARILGNLVNEAEADLAIEGVVVSTLRALGALRGPDAAEAVARLAGDGHHPYRQIALETLGEICDPGVGARTLGELRTDADPRLAAAAEAAEKRCAPRPAEAALPPPSDKSPRP